MLRRDFICFLAGAGIGAPRLATAQTPARTYRVGTLLPGAPLDEKSPLGVLLLKKLEQHGYSLGKNLVFLARGAGGQTGTLGEIIRGMKADQVDVIVAGGFRPCSPARSQMFRLWFTSERAILLQRA
jgi:putative ABC transport system substrate-binding protein